MKLTDIEANEQYKETINSLLTTYKTATNIPRDLWNEASETLRLHQTVNALDGRITRQILSQYMFPEVIIRKVDPDFSGFEPKVRRSEKYKAVYEWLDSNPGAVITTNQLCEVTEMSYPTTLKFIENNPQYFRKIKRGEYEVRNPEAERKADK